MYLAQHNCSIKYIANRAFDLIKSDDVSWQQLSLSLILVKQRNEKRKKFTISNVSAKAEVYTSIHGSFVCLLDGMLQSFIR